MGMGFPMNLRRNRLWLREAVILVLVGVTNVLEVYVVGSGWLIGLPVPEKLTEVMKQLKNK